MVSACLLDSTVIIDAINNRNRRSQLLEGLLVEGVLLACCSINVTEVYMGPSDGVSKRSQSVISRR